VETENFATRALVVEVTVVEFHPDDTNVQSDVYTILDTATSDTDTVTEVVPGNTFLYHTWRGGNANDNESSAVRGRFTSSTVVAFDRSTLANVNAINGHYYVVESTNGDFTVQSDTITVASPDQAETVTLTSTVTMAKTFLLGSYKTDTLTGDNNRNIPYLELQDADTIRLFRQSSALGVTAQVFTITFAGGGAENVQRGVLEQTVSTASEDVNITTVGTQSTSMASIPAASSFKHGGIDGSGSAAVIDSMCDLTLVDLDPGTDVRFQHSIEGTIATCHWSWEVIEWELSAGGSTRRVMVIS
jgi:hypothetical protein